jgi:predicted ArsR family transcriptional regulator
VRYLDLKDLERVDTTETRRRRLLLILGQHSTYTEFALAGLLDASTMAVHDDLLQLMAEGRVLPTGGRGLRTTWGLRRGA